MHRALARRFASSTACRGAVARAADAPFTVEPLELRAPAPNEVLVRVTATGICHTDLVVKNLGLCSFPIVLGHEGAGYVESVGEGVTNVREGDAVVMSYASCGTCSNCARGKPSYCYDHGALNFAGTRADGTTTHKTSAGHEDVFGSFFQQSSFATHALATSSNVVPVGRFLDAGGPLSLAHMAPLGCGIQTGAGAVLNTLQAEYGSSVGVFGCGAVGLSSVMAAHAVGCTTIVAVDINSSRLALAKELGATHVINPTDMAEDESIVDMLRDLSDGGLNYAIDTSGSPTVVRNAVDALRSLGVCGMIAGSPPGTDVCVDQLGVLTAGKTLRGIIQGDSVQTVMIPRMLELHAQGRFPFEKMLTFYEDGLEDLNQAIEDTSSGDVIKAVLRLE